MNATGKENLSKIFNFIDIDRGITFLQPDSSNTCPPFYIDILHMNQDNKLIHLTINTCLNITVRRPFGELAADKGLGKTESHTSDIRNWRIMTKDVPVILREIVR